jgi:hypothetical protein
MLRFVSAVTVLIFHRPAGPGDGERAELLTSARQALARIQERRFRAAGAADVRIIADAEQDLPFGRRLERAIDSLPAERRSGGLVVLGSGGLPLATARDLATFVKGAGGLSATALANNRYSGDIVAIPAAASLPRPIELAADNGLPRWLGKCARRDVRDLRDRWRLQVDLDSPLDLVLAARARNLPAELRDLARKRLAAPSADPLREAVAGVSRVIGDPHAELVVVGRTSAGTLRWLEVHASCRVRALVEERGLRAAEGTIPGQRPPRSVLGRLLDQDGPGSLAARLAELGDAAIVDTRVLLAHRFGSDEGSWPAREDRFASDLLEPGAIRNPWLQALTESAVGSRSTLPILLGGHSLVGPGLRLLAPQRPGGRGRPTPARS